MYAHTHIHTHMHTKMHTQVHTHNNKSKQYAKSKMSLTTTSHDPHLFLSLFLLSLSLAANSPPAPPPHFSRALPGSSPATGRATRNTKDIGRAVK